MKKDLMVVGMKAIGDGSVLEIELIDLITCKAKTDVMSHIMKGDFVGATKEITETQKQYRNKIYLPKNWCTENLLTMFSSVELDITRENKTKMVEK